MAHMINNLGYEEYMYLLDYCKVIAKDYHPDTSQDSRETARDVLSMSHSELEKFAKEYGGIASISKACPNFASALSSSINDLKLSLRHKSDSD